MYIMKIYMISVCYRNVWLSSYIIIILLCQLGFKIVVKCTLIGVVDFDIQRSFY